MNGWAALTVIVCTALVAVAWCIVSVARTTPPTGKVLVTRDHLTAALEYLRRAQVSDSTNPTEAEALAVMALGQEAGR